MELTTGLKPKSWKFFEKHFERAPVTLFTLQKLYHTWKDIDLYFGALLEKVPRDRWGLRNQVIEKLRVHVKKTRWFHEKLLVKMKKKNRSILAKSKQTTGQLQCF